MKYHVKQLSAKDIGQITRRLIQIFSLGYRNALINLDLPGANLVHDFDLKYLYD